MSDFSGIYKNIKLGMFFSQKKKKKKKKHPETNELSASYLQLFLWGGGVQINLRATLLRQ